MAISRYRNTTVVSGSYFESYNFPNIDLTKVPTYSVVPTAEDRLDTLAFKLLGAGEYWWVIAILNDIEWAFNFTPGTTLKIPVDVEDVLKLI